MSSPEIRSEKSIAIAGGGIIGLSIAWRLAQLGHAVTVYEAGRVGGEASWAAAGMLAPGGEIDSPSELASLALESRRLYPSFVRELEEAAHVSIDYQECGGLDLAYSDEEAAALEARAARQAELGIHSKSLAPERVQAFWPRVRMEGLIGAHFYREDALVNPRDLIGALSTAAEAGGIRILPNSAVQSIIVAPGSVTVCTSKESAIYAGAVVAAGAWSGSIEVEGVPPLPSAHPVKGHLIGYRQPAQICNSILRRGHTYLAQRASGFLIAGSSMEEVGFNREIAPDIALSLAEKAAFLLPHLQETTPAEVWVGFRPASDALHVGCWHSPRLYLAYGHFRNGILLTPITAQRVSRELSASLESF